MGNVPHRHWPHDPKGDLIGGIIVAILFGAAIMCCILLWVEGETPGLIIAFSLYPCFVLFSMGLGMIGGAISEMKSENSGQEATANRWRMAFRIIRPVISFIFLLVTIYLARTTDAPSKFEDTEMFLWGFAIVVECILVVMGD